MRVDIPFGLQLSFGTVFYAAVEKDCTGGLIIEMFDDSDTACADVVLPYGCPQSVMLNPVEGPFEVYEDITVKLLVLEMFITEDS